MYIQVNGVRLYYEVTGAGDPILLLHGNGESHEIFDVLVPLLARRHRVYTVDSRCHGRSEQTAELSYEQMARDMIALIRALSLERPVFYGFSDGGIVGLMVAMEEPTLLSRLIVSGANLWPGGMKTGTLLVTKLVALTGNRLYRLMASSPRIRPEDLGKIRIPTLVLAGERDVIRRSHTRLIASHIPSGRLKILPGETHGSYIVHSSKLLSILEEECSS